MSKKLKFPSAAEITEMNDLLAQSVPSRPLAKNASTVDKIKHRICKEFVIYKNLNQTTQKDLANKVGIDESLMSKILHYHFDEFTIDRLVKFLNILYPNLDFKFDLAS